MTRALRVLHFAPRLRNDLRFRHGRNPSTIILHDASNGQAHLLRPIEAFLAQQMNGARTLEQLVEIASAYDARLNTQVVENLITKLADQGLLADLDTLPPGTTIPPPESTYVETIETQDDVEYEPPPSNVVEFPHSAGSSDLFREPRGLGGPLDDEAAATNFEPEDPADRTVNSTYSAGDEPPPELEDWGGAPIDRTLASPGTGSGSLGEEPTSPGDESSLQKDPSEVSVSDPEESEASAADPGVIPVLPALPPLPVAAEAPAAEPNLALKRALEIAKRWRIAIGFFSIVIVASLIPYPRYVTESCVVLPMTDVFVRAQVEGIIAEILVDEGQQVTAGQILARLDDRDIAVAIQQAEADVQRLKANHEKMVSGSRPEEIRRARNSVAAASRDVKFAEIEFNRKAKLFAQGVGSAEQRDNAARNLEIKRAALGEARAELDLMLAGFRKEEVAVAEAELRRAEAELDGLLKKREKFVVTSPVDGQVVTPKFRDKLHSKTNPGDTIAKVADTSRVKIEIYIPEREVDLLRIGQPTVVKVQSLPLKPFEGKLTFVAPVVETINGQVVVRATTMVENRENLLQAGMTGYAEIDTGQSTLLRLALRRVIRWVRVRFLI